MTVNCFSQSDFRNGYVIKSNLDTLYGEIDYRGAIINAKKCVFRERNSSLVQNFSPNEITAYRFVDGKYYLSRQFMLNDISHQVFLEFLIDGAIDIYYYRDLYKDYYLIDNGIDEIIELKNEKLNIKLDGKSYTRDSNEYLRILKYMFRDGPDVSKKINSVDLSHKSLIKITSEYHNEVCSDQECIIYERVAPKRKSNLGLIMGANNASVHRLRDFNEYYYLNEGVNINNYASIGLFYKVNLPSINENFYFQYEVTYSRINLNVNSTYVEPLYQEVYSNTAQMKQDVLRNSAILKYELHTKKIKPFFQAGISLSQALNVNYSRKLEYTDLFGETSYHEFDDSPFSTSDIGVNLGVGLTTTIFNDKELFMDFRYQRSFILLNRLHTNTYSINLAYQLWSKSTSSQ